MKRKVGSGMIWLFWDGILGHQFDTRLGSFAPCCSQSFYWRIFKKTGSTLNLKTHTKKSAKQDNSSQFVNSILWKRKLRVENQTQIRAWECFAKILGRAVIYEFISKNSLHITTHPLILSQTVIVIVVYAKKPRLKMFKNSISGCTRLPGGWRARQPRSSRVDGGCPAPAPPGSAPRRRCARPCSSPRLSCSRTCSKTMSILIILI